MKIEKMPLGPLGTNCYLVIKDKVAMIVDPGGDADKLYTYLEEANINPIAILLTHAHFDHIGAVEDVRNRYQIPVLVHKAEADWLSNPNLNGSALFRMEPISAGPADKYIQSGEMDIGPFSFHIRETPGHSPGGVAFVFPEEKSVISGDSLFQRGIGRTDLPGGDFEVLVETIKSKLFSLPDDYTVYPGHGPETVIGDEKAHNQFVG
ncbi:MBL fold metallo-hydrolase [Sediminibacillus halophilus]|uniref:Glyoxylase, beta-lactamase superfamily II n=1 Tax=Sediminibacillus halophilus TaxID=482461 RepID=A0A1G9YGN7_9BACI|nr:MBL fold metallo-hydrolase [Sediminibacillus halophilus]SDN07726.1 Glyoxylase, beta-lactamase superfamily II [Sediminibacillus halophilus]